MDDLFGKPETTKGHSPIFFFFFFAGGIQCPETAGKGKVALDGSENDIICFLSFSVVTVQ